MGRFKNALRIVGVPVGVAGMFVGGINGYKQEQHSTVARGEGGDVGTVIEYGLRDQPRIIGHWVLQDTHINKPGELNRRNAGTEELVFALSLVVLGAAIRSED